jgi:hypothetical protein
MNYFGFNGTVCDDVVQRTPRAIDVVGGVIFADLVCRKMFPGIAKTPFFLWMTDVIRIRNALWMYYFKYKCRPKFNITTW